MLMLMPQELIIYPLMLTFASKNSIPPIFYPLLTFTWTFVRDYPSNYRQDNRKSLLIFDGPPEPQASTASCCSPFAEPQETELHKIKISEASLVRASEALHQD